MSELEQATLIRPVSGGWISQRYGENPGNYAYPCRPDRSHNGIDFAVDIGTPVVAAADGRVSVAGQDLTGYGLHIRVEHTFGMTLYGHLSSLLVVSGQQVKAGEVIGLSGNSGNSTGAHLHFELRKPGNKGGCKDAVDPARYMSNDPLSPTPQPAPQSQTWKVIAPAGVNVRTGAGTDARILGTLGWNTKLELVEVWGRTKEGRWIAAYYAGTTLMEEEIETE